MNKLEDVEQFKENNKYPIDRYLFEDLKTARKIKEDPNYYNRLLIAYDYIKSLGIISELQFYLYATVLEELKGINYSDTQAFQRFRNEEYYKYVQNHLEPTTPLKRIK